MDSFDSKKILSNLGEIRFPVNFSGVPHIGQKIFEFLNFKDLDNCRTVCKGWLNFLGENRSLWFKLLEKEEIKLDSDLHFCVNFFKYATPEIREKLEQMEGKMMVLRANRAGTVVDFSKRISKIKMIS